MSDEKQRPSSERIRIELSRNEWIALLACAELGADEAETIHGGYVAGTAEWVINQLRPAIFGESSLQDAAAEYEKRQLADEEESKAFKGKYPEITPSA